MSIEWWELSVYLGIAFLFGHVIGEAFGGDDGAAA